MDFVFEVSVKNRIVYRRTGRRIKGAQGDWFHDAYNILAPDEVVAKEAAINRVKPNRMLGITKRRAARYLERQVKVVNIRRVS